MKIKLFPFDKIPKDSNVVIYGMGVIGQGFVSQIKCLNYCNVIGCIDRNYKKKNLLSEMNFVLSPCSIEHIKYDYIVVASVRYKYDIEKILQDEFFVPKEKIIILDDNYYVEDYITPERDWTNYYIEAEKSAMIQFKEIIEPILIKYLLIDNKKTTMDFACGRGRIANILKQKYRKMILCDISERALAYCQDRFSDVSNIEYIKSLPERLLINNESLDFIYSWDAMVHFNYKMLDIYISEFSRVLKKGGHCFIHHSNLEECYSNDKLVKSENFNENIFWRAKVSRKDVAKIARRNNFEILEQTNLKWRGVQVDCITLLRKRG